MCVRALPCNVSALTDWPSPCCQARPATGSLVCMIFGPQITSKNRCGEMSSPLLDAAPYSCTDLQLHRRHGLHVHTHTHLLFVCFWCCLFHIAARSLSNHSHFSRPKVFCLSLNFLSHSLKTHTHRHMKWKYWDNRGCEVEPPLGPSKLA